MARRKTVADFDAELEALQDDKDKFLAGVRSRMRDLSARRDVAVAEEAAAAKVEAMSPAERQAVAAELARVGGES